MTKEENIATLNEHLDHWKRLLSEKICDQDEGEKTIDALQNAIKALEQEPKMGHWELDEHLNKIGMFYKYICSECGSKHRAMYDYCPSCGSHNGGDAE